jgi:hypothetical protein
MGKARSLMIKFEVFVKPPSVLGKPLLYLRPKIAHHLRRKPLSFHSVSFGPDYSIPLLRRMAQVALEEQENACQTPGLPAAVSGPPSSFANALDTVRTYAC